MSDNYTPEEITAIIHAALGLQIQKPKPAIVAINDDGTNPATEEYTIPVKIEAQEETYYAKISPVIDVTALANGSPVDIVVNSEGEYEATGLNPVLGRLAYSGTSPTPNFAFRQHSHQDEIGGGQLDAGLIFASGQVQLEYGGTEANLSATGAGHLVQATAGAAVSVIKDNFAAAVAPTVNEDSGDGYAIGSLWFDTTNDNIYIAMDVSVGAAVWRQLDGSAVASGWTDDGAVVRLTTSTDSVSIGTAASTAKLDVLGDDPDEFTMRVRAAPSQSFPIFSIEDDSGDIFFYIGPSGQVLVNPSEAAGGDFIVNGPSGATPFFVDVSANAVFIDAAVVINDSGVAVTTRIETDNDANAFVVNGATDRVGIGDATPDGRFAVVGRADEIQAIFRGNGTQTSNILEVQNSAAAAVASVSNAGLISGVQLGLTSAVASTTTPNVLIRDTAQNFGHAKGGGSTGLYISLDGMYAARTSDTVVTTATAPGTLIGTITLPANFWRIGRVLEYEFSGHSEIAVSGNRLRVVLQNGATDLFDLQTSAGLVFGGARAVWGKIVITCRTTGATGTVQPSYQVYSNLWEEGGGGGAVTTTSTVDTTAAITFNVRLYWNSATSSPTITVKNDNWKIAG